MKLIAALALIPVAILAVANVAHADEPTPTTEPSTTTTVAACVDEYHAPDGSVEEIPCDQWTPCPGVMFGAKVPTKYYPDRCPKPAATTTSTAPPVTAPKQGQCPNGQYDPTPSAPPPHTCLPLPAATPAPEPTPEPVAEETTTTTEAAAIPVNAPARKKPAPPKATTTTTATTVWHAEVWLYLW